MSDFTSHEKTQVIAMYPEAHCVFLPEFEIDGKKFRGNNWIIYDHGAETRTMIARSNMDEKYAWERALEHANEMFLEALQA